MPLVFKRIDFPSDSRRWVVLQDFMARPLLICFAIFAAMLLFLMARHDAVLLPGIIGVFAVVVLGNFLGTTNAKSQFLEIGFADGYFYLQSAYDIAFKKDLKMYPITYANAIRKGDTLHINYIDQNIKLNREQWENWYDICVIMLSE